MERSGHSSSENPQCFSNTSRCGFAEQQSSFSRYCNATYVVSDFFLVLVEFSFFPVSQKLGLQLNEKHLQKSYACPIEREASQKHRTRSISKPLKIFRRAMRALYTKCLSLMQCYVSLNVVSDFVFILVECTSKNVRKRVGKRMFFKCLTNHV